MIFSEDENEDDDLIDDDEIDPSVTQQKIDEFISKIVKNSDKSREEALVWLHTNRQKIPAKLGITAKKLSNLMIDNAIGRDNKIRNWFHEAMDYHYMSTDMLDIARTKAGVTNLSVITCL